MRVRLVRYLVGFAIATAAVQMVATTAVAHGDPPEGEQIFAVDGGWVYLTNFGTITSEHPQHYVCEEAFFASEDFSIAALDVDRWATFSRNAAAATDDGCHYEVTRPLPTTPSDVAVDASSGGVAFTVREDDASQVWYSEDGGRQWNQVDVDVEELNLTGIGFLDADQLVAMGYRTDEEVRGEAVMIEIDAHTGARTDREIDAALVYPELLDAGGGDVLWHARRNGDTEVYWSQKDALEAGHFASPRWPTAGALAPDGERAFLGGVDEDGRGVFRARRGEPSTWEEVIAGHRALCLAVDGDDLLVCGHRRDDDHDLLRWHPDDGAEEVVDFRDLKGPRDDCPDGSRVVGTCPPVWPELARALDIEIDEETEEEPPEESNGGSCSTTGTAAPMWWMVLVVLAALVRIRTQCSVCFSIDGCADQRT